MFSLTMYECMSVSMDDLTVTCIVFFPYCYYYFFSVTFFQKRLSRLRLRLNFQIFFQTKFVRKLRVIFLDVAPGPEIYQISCFGCSPFFSKSIKDRTFKRSAIIDSLQPLHTQTSAFTSGRHRIVTKKPIFFNFFVFQYFFYFNSCQKLFYESRIYNLF